MKTLATALGALALLGSSVAAAASPPHDWPFDFNLALAANQAGVNEGLGKFDDLPGLPHTDGDPGVRRRELEPVGVADQQDVVFAGGGEEEHWSLAMMFDALNAGSLCLDVGNGATWSQLPGMAADAARKLRERFFNALEKAGLLRQGARIYFEWPLDEEGYVLATVMPGAIRIENEAGWWTGTREPDRTV